LFLLSWTYCADYLRRPAWLASLVGDFLTQFYYYRYVGAAILTASLLVVGDLTRRSLQRIGLRHGTFAIAIVVMTLFALFSLQHSYRLASVIAADGGCALAWLVMLLLPHLSSTRGGRVLMTILLLCASALAFWLFGNGGFLCLLLLIIYSIAHRRHQPLGLSVVVTALPLSLLPLTKSCYMMNVGDILFAPGLGKLAAPEWTRHLSLLVEQQPVVCLCQQARRRTLWQALFLLCRPSGACPQTFCVAATGLAVLRYEPQEFQRARARPWSSALRCCRCAASHEARSRWLPTEKAIKSRRLLSIQLGRKSEEHIERNVDDVCLFVALVG